MFGEKRHKVYICPENWDQLIENSTGKAHSGEKFRKKKLEIGKILVFHSRRTGEIIPVLLHQTVCENVRLCELSSSLVFNKLLSNLATLLILRRYFQLLRRIFGNLTLQNLTKKKHRERVYYRRMLTRSFL